MFPLILRDIVDIEFVDSRDNPISRTRTKEKKKKRNEVSKVRIRNERNLNFRNRRIGNETIRHKDTVVPSQIFFEIRRSFFQTTPRREKTKEKRGHFAIYIYIYGIYILAGNSRCYSLSMNVEAPRGILSFN